jgi:phosphopantetheinyl transferase
MISTGQYPKPGGHEVANLIQNMGLLVKKQLENGCLIGIWQMEEEEHYFTEKLDLQAFEADELAKLKGRRRLEWLASRFLVHEMLLEQGHADRIPVLKDGYGKPHIWGTPFHLSFSHSHEQVAVILAKRPCGIDIQHIVQKIDRLAGKFMGEAELASLVQDTRLEHLHFYWAAKEAVYKAHGRKQLDFKSHIFIQPFDYQGVGSTTALIAKDGERLHYELFYEKMASYVLAWCLEAIAPATQKI